MEARSARKGAHTRDPSPELELPKAGSTSRLSGRHCRGVHQMERIGIKCPSAGSLW
jgi:hypothetical protein